MKNDLQKRITELLEEKKNDAERCLENVKKCCIDDENFISYCEGRADEIGDILKLLQKMLKEEKN